MKPQEQVKEVVQEQVIETIVADAPEAPSLTLTPFDSPETKPVLVTDAQKEEEQVEDMTAAILSEQELKQVEQFSKQIDLKDTNSIMQYGAGAQKKVADFSEAALNNVRTKDLGEVGGMLSSLVTELKSFDVKENEKGIRAWFKRSANKVEAMKAKYAKAETNVNKVSESLEKHQVTLLRDVAMLDNMYATNQNYYKELTMYILAGKKRLERAKNEELVALNEKAKQTGLPEDAQAANDFSALINRFEKKIYDLELTRVISIQMGPQIRLVQSNDTVMSEKIQSTLVNTIPLWKSQMVLALGMSHSMEAAKAQGEVTDMTNELLKKNADKLKMATIETAKESERAIVDIETL
ncbi:MAG: toxic anion resistance protein, partial [Lachnospiraceae bacterium]|nr:toxic anion resistance protein [Lachnospiraceae bacterium]